MNLAFISCGNIRARYHWNYDGLLLNDKGDTLFTENILLTLNEVAWPQSVKKNSSSKSSSDSDDIKEILSRQLNVLNRGTLRIWK